MAGEKKRTKRRRRGEWSVEKLPSGRFRAVGSKMVDVTQPDGTVERVRKKVTSPTFATEKEAYDWIAANRNRPAARTNRTPLNRAPHGTATNGRSEPHAPISTGRGSTASEAAGVTVRGSANSNRCPKHAGHRSSSGSLRNLHTGHREYPGGSVVSFSVAVIGSPPAGGATGNRLQRAGRGYVPAPSGGQNPRAFK